MTAFICSGSHKKSRKRLARGWQLDRFISRWGEIARKKKFDLVDEVRRFFVYWNECFVCPELVPDSEIKPASAGQQAPNEWRILATLMADFHMTRRQAYDTEVAFAAALWAANVVRSNRGSLKSYEATLGDEAAFRAAQELTREKAASADNKGAACSA